MLDFVVIVVMLDFVVVVVMLDFVVVVVMLDFVVVVIFVAVVVVVLVFVGVFASYSHQRLHLVAFTEAFIFVPRGRVSLVVELASMTFPT